MSTAEQVVLVTGTDLEHRYVANRLAAELQLSAILVAHEPHRAMCRHLRRHGPRTLVSRTLRRIVLAAICDRKRRAVALRRVFAPVDVYRFIRADLVHDVPGINSSACLTLLRALRPDILLVYGTAVVTRPVLGTANRLALNLHTGIAPFYRGAGSSFWPIHNGELGRLGATIHECTAMLDGGDTFSRVTVTLQPSDGLHEIFARCVVVGTTAYVEVVRALLAGRLKPEPQCLERGREYRAADRGIVAELRTRWAICRGTIRRACAERRTGSAACQGSQGR